uniref:Cytochrome c oxidase subunit 3 n=1 Tax=Xenophyes cascus TaxID=984453 RepID=L7NAZ1_9HEMI|nr:cytochrome c oxidase subunit III [Xenophyes cascus]
MKSLNNHPFHLVTKSPWPIINSMGIMSLMVGMLKWIHTMNINLLMFALLATIGTNIQWWRDITRESMFQGTHTEKVSSGLKLGMILFIISEVLFFTSFFWSYFHSSLVPSHDIGAMWPPLGVSAINPSSLPLLNTMILISSGMTITLSHYNMLSNKMKSSSNNIMITIMLGLCFTSIQIYEYFQSPFTIKDNIYGSSFFMLTGFHGIHVVIGTWFMIISLMRALNNHFSKTHHLNFELAAWYWHFVDVVWLFLFIFIYWWGS